MTTPEEKNKSVPTVRKGYLSLRIFQLVLWLSVLALIGFYSLRGAVFVPPTAPPKSTGQLWRTKPADVSLAPAASQLPLVAEANLANQPGAAGPLAGQFPHSRTEEAR